MCCEVCEYLELPNESKFCFQAVQQNIQHFKKSKHFKKPTFQTCSTFQNIKHFKKTLKTQHVPKWVIMSRDVYIPMWFILSRDVQQNLKHFKHSTLGMSKGSRFFKKHHAAHSSCQEVYLGRSHGKCGPAPVSGSGSARSGAGQGADRCGPDGAAHGPMGIP